MWHNDGNCKMSNNLSKITPDMIRTDKRASAKNADIETGQSSTCSPRKLASRSCLHRRNPTIWFKILLKPAINISIHDMILNQKKNSRERFFFEGHLDLVHNTIEDSPAENVKHKCMITLCCISTCCEHG